MRSAWIAAVLVAGGVASADPGHPTASLRTGLGHSEDAWNGDGPQGRTWFLDIEAGWRVNPYLSVVGFAGYARFDDAVSDAFFPMPVVIHQRDLGLGFRIYGHLGPVFAGLGLGENFDRHWSSSGSFPVRGRLAQLTVGGDIVHTHDLAFGLAAHASHANLEADQYVLQTALWLNVRWR